MAAAEKQLARAKEAVASGSAYEAQQLLKTSYARLLRQNKVADALDLTQGGVELQLDHSQVTCASELAQLFVDALTSSEQPYDSATVDRLLAISRAFQRRLASLSDPSGPSPDAKQRDLLASAADGCSAFLRSALRWSARAPSAPPRGDPRLHDAFALLSWRFAPGKDLAPVLRHFAVGADSVSFAAVLSQAMAEVRPYACQTLPGRGISGSPAPSFPDPPQCHSDETDLVLANAVLQCLAVSNLRTANHLMALLAPPSPLAASLPAEATPPPPPAPTPDGLPLPDSKDRPAVPDSPLVHYLHFLLLTLLRDAAPLFLHLRSLYQLSLRRDPHLLKYVDDIGHAFYNIQPQSGPSGLLAGLLQMLNE